MSGPGQDGKAFQADKIDLPSDSIAFGKIRRERPHAFLSYRAMSEMRIAELNIAATIASEVELAERAFNSARSSTAPRIVSGRPREQILELLNDDYKRYGISEGMSMTRQLVRGLEQRARGQAAGAATGRG